VPTRWLSRAISGIGTGWRTRTASSSRRAIRKSILSTTSTILAQVDVGDQTRGPARLADDQVGRDRSSVSRSLK
jgi:hypothetical protein